MNRERLLSQLRIDEGESLEVYADSLGYPTVGVGHRVTKSDTLTVGDTITPQRKEALFIWDVGIAINNCRLVFSDFSKLPEPVQEVLVNMMFNLGSVHFATFRRFIAAIKLNNWKEAAREMEDSVWWKQVGDRAKRLQNMLLEG